MSPRGSPAAVPLWNSPSPHLPAHTLLPHSCCREAPCLALLVSMTPLCFTYCPPLAAKRRRSTTPGVGHLCSKFPTCLPLADTPLSQEGSASDVAQEQEPVPLPQQGAVLLVGFSQEEFTLITDAAPTLFPATAAAASGSGSNEEEQEEEEGVAGRGVTEPLIIPVVASNCHLSTAELLQVQLSGGSPLTASLRSTAGSSCAAASGAGAEADEQLKWRLAEGRVILLLGEAAMAHGAMLNERLVDGLGVAPAVVGCVVASQMGAPVREVVHRLRAAHIR